MLVTAGPIACDPLDPPRATRKAVKTPFVKIVQPEDGTVLRDTVDVVFNAKDAAEVQLFVNDEQIRWFTEPPYTWTVDLADYPMSDVTLRAYAFDERGKETEHSVVVRTSATGGRGGPFPGDQQGSVLLGDLEREYFLYVPSSYDDDVPIPLVSVHHGSGSVNSKGAFYRDYWMETAEEHGFIVLAQDSIDETQAGWLRQDVDYWNVMIDEVLADYNVDRSRVYVWGFSAGAHFAHLLGLTYPHRIAAYAVHSGSLRPFNLIEVPATLTRKIPVGIAVGHQDPNRPVGELARDTFIAAGWELEDRLIYTEFRGGHVAPRSHMPLVWNFFADWTLLD